MTIEIALTGAAVWPTSNPLADHLPQMSWRLFQEATARWNGAPSLAEHLDQHAQSVISQCFTDALIVYWERRAREFEQLGNDAAAEETGSAQRCFETAQACRNKARFVAMYGDPDLDADLAVVIGELPAAAQTVERCPARHQDGGQCDRDTGHHDGHRLPTYELVA